MNRRELPPGEIHLWRAKLDFPTPTLNDFRSLLSAEELARAERLIRSEDGIHFTAARGLLRRLLGDYLGHPPESLRFGYGPQGRPHLEGGYDQPAPSFNLSHSGGAALFAFALDREVGVDLEAWRESVDEGALARRYFAPEESERLAALPEAERRREFFRLWTQKEAYLKAQGLGVSAIDRSPELDPDFLTTPIEWEDGYSAALSYRRPEAQVRLFRWT